MDMTAACELLISGEPERTGHLLVAGVAHQLRRDRNRRGGQRRYLGSCLSSGVGGPRPAPAHLPAEVIEPQARLGIGFHLLRLQLEIQRLHGAIRRFADAEVMAGSSGGPRGGLQHCARHRLRLPSLRLDQQKPFFDTHPAKGHGLALPPDHRSTPGRSKQRRACSQPVTVRTRRPHTYARPSG